MPSLPTDDHLRLKEKPQQMLDDDAKAADK